MADQGARLFIALYTDADVHGGLAAQIRRANEMEDGFRNLAEFADRLR